MEGKADVSGFQIWTWKMLEAGFWNLMGRKRANICTPYVRPYNVNFGCTFLNWIRAQRIKRNWPYPSNLREIN